MSSVSFDSGGVRCAGVHLSGESDDFADEDGRLLTYKVTEVQRA